MIKDNRDRNERLSYNARLDRIRELEKALEPFIHKDFCKSTVGCQEDHDILYERDKARLYLGDFRKARDILK